MQKLNQVLENLLVALEESGLGNAKVDIKCHHLTPLETQSKVRDMMLAGFGNRVIADNGIHRYSHTNSSFSWITLEQQSIKISLFYELKNLS